MESMSQTCEHLRETAQPGVNGCRVKGVCTPVDCDACDSHTGQSETGIVRFMRRADYIGTNYHRSGWPWAMAGLQCLHSGRSDLLFDDFVEQTWIYSQRTEPIANPWVGIFHHPPSPPEWTRRQDRIDQLHNNPAFAESLNWLELAICLSDYLADWIAEHWQVPTAVVKHPTAIDAEPWLPNEWLQMPRVLQCGWYLRNVRLIHQIDTPQLRMRLMPRREHILKHETACQAFIDREEHKPDRITELDYIDNSGYDYLLSRSVVVMEVLDAAANNVTLECLARNTPLVVNRHPAVVEYLGEDYPLYFDDHSQIGSMLDSEELILSGHEYLKAADKSFLSVDAFQAGVEAAIVGVQ